MNGTAETDESNFERERDAKLLLKGLSGFHHINPIDSNSNNSNINGNTNNTSEDWEAAFKYVMMRNNKQLEEQQHQQHQHQQEELFRAQELHKQRNSLVNNLNGMPPTQHLQQQHNMYSNGIDHKNVDYMNGMSEFNRLTQAALLQKQQQQQRLHNNMLSVQENAHIYPGSNNMSKFFDFHKNQQNQVDPKYNQKYI